jgi:hypothetical protein
MRALGDRLMLRDTTINLWREAMRIPLVGAVRRTACGATVAVLAGIASTPAMAAADTRAICRAVAHVALSRPLTGVKTGGRLRLTSTGELSCAGELGGTLVAGAGSFIARGVYRNGDYNPLGDPLGGFDTCALGVARLSFFGSAPVFLSNRRWIRMAGDLRLSPVAQSLVAEGTGRAGSISVESRGSEPVSYSGIGAFLPDPGQDCSITAISSGTLSEQFVVTT